MSGILGGAFVEVVWLAPPERLSLRGRHGYDAMLRILKSKARQEADADGITSYLPNYAALEMTLPDDPFFNDNPDFRDGRWKPVSLAITRAQIKALG